jgi:tRNA threonylcarbamoyladenosine biosynthesis protein TsaB
METATAVCSVALVKNGELIAIKQSDQKNAHSRVLNLFIDDLMDEAGLDFPDLDAVAVSKGPGSYTGLRIGVSTAKGIGYALNIPVIAPGTLPSMAAGFLSANPTNHSSVLLCPMIDARRMAVFAAVYDTTLQALIPADAVIVDEDAFAGLPDEKPVVFFGDGAEKCIETLSKRPNWKYFPGFTNSAAHMAQLVTDCFHAGNFEDLAYFEPFYLKDFIAGKPKVKGLT